MQESATIEIVEKIFHYLGLAVRESHWFLDICSRHTGNFLNIGIAGGSSVIMMANASPSANILAVDCFSPYVEHGVLHDYGPSKIQYLQHLQETGFADRVKNYFMTSSEFFKQNNDKFDLIFVDGGHDYTIAMQDIKTSWDRLNMGGALLIHDFLPTDYRTDIRTEPGVTQSVWEFFGGKILDAELHESLLCINKFDFSNTERLRNAYFAKNSK